MDLITLIALSLVTLFLVYGASYFSGRFTFNVIKDIKYKLFTSICNGTIEETNKLNAGDLISRNNSEMGAIQNFLQNKVPELLYVPLMFIASSLYMISINWKLYLLCYSLTPISILLINKFNKKSIQYSTAYYESLGAANGVIKECIDGIDTIKTYNLSNHILANCKKAFDKVLSSVLKSEIYDSCQLPFYFMLYESPKILCILFGGFAVIKGDFSLGDLIAYGQLIIFVSDPINKLSSLLGSVRKFNAAFSRIDELLNFSLDINLSETLTYSTTNTEGVHLELKNLCFTYDGSRNILDNVSFKFPTGKKIALVGLSGEGKTTLLNLISSLYTSKDGDILLNHIPYSKLNKDYIRSNISYVSQDSFLFPMSIGENIGIGKTNSPHYEIEQASKSAKCHDFIMTLPKGYDTFIGEQGNNLSGGQKQRISIARALLKDAPILLMDEPTSALDLETETALMKDLFEASKNKTLIISTHRYSTIKEVDLILVISSGKIAESGTHEELISLNGLYATLYNKQFSINGGDINEAI